jgi:uncharacterized membrane protein YraQ (UPF0718 family)
MFQNMLVGFYVRTITSLVQASPFILAGFATAAVLSRFFGYEGTRKLFGEGTRSSLFRAWVIGMLLPVCSLGAIPVIREMRRAGIRGGTIMAFAMSGPLFNPLSLLYGLTLSEPIAILSFAACSLAIVTIVGLIWDWFFPDSAAPMVEQKEVAYGIRRVLAVWSASAREASGGSLIYMSIALLGVGLLGSFIPANSLQHTFNHDNPKAPLYMTAMAIPVYATPMLAMSQLGMMFQHANSIGAAFVLLVLGAGMNLGVMAWIYREYGVRRASVWMVLLLSVVLGLAYGLDKPLFPKDIEPSDHTHAFDIYCRPFPDSVTTGLWAQAQQKLERDISPFEWRPLWLFVGLIVSGVVLKAVDRSKRFDAWLEQAPPKTLSGRGDIIVPGSVLGGISLIGLLGISIAGAFAFYPAPDDCLEAMTDSRVEALSAALTMNHAETKYWSERYDDWTRKLEVGTWMRNWELSDYHRWKARVVREHLEMLEHEVQDGEADAVRKRVPKISRAHNRMSTAFREEL